VSVSQNHLENERADPVEVLMHCKICVEESTHDISRWEADFTDDPDLYCSCCGDRLSPGGFEPGKCSMCGLVRDSGQALLEWQIEGPLDMCCPGCAEADS